LFLKTDTVVHEGERFWRLDTIVTGLGPADSTYAWIVPETTLNWAKVLAIAYGPGWQYDESDSAFSIGPHGVSEAGTEAVWRWQPPTVVRGVLFFGDGRRGQSTTGQSLVFLLDAAGRKVMQLAPGANDVRSLAPGVYFLRPASGGERSPGRVTKVVLAE